MLIERGVIKLGLEAEIPTWKNGRTYYKVAKELVKAGYMQAPDAQWSQHHKYHCSCVEGGCKYVRQGDLMVPPLVSMTYDATLPKEGAEFIVSPILLAETRFRDQLEELWNIIVLDAEWTMDLGDYHGNIGVKCSPSIHMHVSANKDSVSDSKGLVGPTMKHNPHQEDIIHALALFSPELFALADTSSFRRGLKYRLPTREIIASDQGHHGFIDVRRVIPEQIVYIEWRLFEAAYHDWDYLEGSAYLAASLTRAFLERETLSTLMSYGYRDPYDDRLTRKAVQNDDTAALLSLVNRNRLDVLHNICMEQLSDDEYGMRIVDQMFIAAERKL